MNSEKNPSVLVVDDNELNRVVALRLLGIIGVDADAVSSGEKGVELYSEVQHDLILMDVRMPFMCGKETTKALRELERQRGWSQAIVIGMTAVSKGGIDTAEYIKAGMDDCVSKPIRVDFLKGVLASISKEEMTENSESTIMDHDDSERGDLVDFEQSSLFLMSVEGVLLYQKFISQMNERLPRVEAGVLDEQTNEFAELIHELMGAAALFGFSGLKRRLAGVGQLVKSEELVDAQSSARDLSAILQQSCQLVKSKYELVF